MSDRLLPTGSSALEVAAAEALASLGAMNVPLRQLWNPQTCPVALLPYLAWAWSVEGFSAAMGPIGDAFSLLKPVFEWVGNKIKELWDWFGKLLEPVKSTQSELATAGEWGKKFGNMLAEALKLPGKA